jgi:cytochrome c peroxidase
MKRRTIHLLALLSIVVVGLQACRHDTDDPVPEVIAPSFGTPLEVIIPANFPAMPIPPNNPFTVEGVDLGRFLFYDERLSGNNTQSCGSCHAPRGGLHRSWQSVQCGHRRYPREPQLHGLDQSCVGYTVFLGRTTAYAGGADPGSGGEPDRDARDVAQCGRKAPGRPCLPA